MIDVRKMLHVARLARPLAAALAISACARTAEDAQANAAGQATPAVSRTSSSMWATVYFSKPIRPS